MGDFFGHCLPGTFFILVGVWWLVNIYISHRSCMTSQGGAKYVNSLSFPIRGVRRMAGIDGLILAVLCGIGMLVELVGAPLLRTHGQVPMALVQHATMYFFFGQFAVVLFVTTRRTATSPMTSFMGFKSRELQYVTFAMALGVEGLLFSFHLYGRDEIEVLLHTLLLYAIFGGAISTVLELVFKENVLVAVTRVFFILLQGTWFWQVSFYLYNPFRRHDEAVAYEGKDLHEYMMLIACSFAWHMAGICLFILVSGALVASRCRMRCCGAASGPAQDEDDIKDSLTVSAEGMALLDVESSEDI